MFHTISRPVTAVLATIFVLAASIAAAPAAQAQTYNVIYNLPAGGGGWPQGGLILKNGGLFGIVGRGGILGGCCGGVFELANDGSGWSYSTLYNFNGRPDGYGPAGIDFGPDGNLYGTTTGGPIAATATPWENCGGLGCGTIFKMTPNGSTWTETVICSFGIDCAGTSNYVADDFAFDGAGNIYGIAGGGEWGAGIAYELTPSGGGWINTVIFTFNYYETGWQPSGGLVMDRNGLLYGASTYSGGMGQCDSYTCGTVFQLVRSTNGWTENVLYRFQGLLDGGQPSYGVILDASGNLYGTTNIGGANGGGTVFELTPGENGWTLTTLYNFTAQVGGGNLTLDAAGNLYGISQGQDNVYELSPGENGWTYSDLHDFSQNGEWFPFGKLALDGSGNIYGMTAYGGTYGDGVAFEVTPGSRSSRPVSKRQRMKASR